MKRALTVTAGLVAGLLLAGLAGPVLVAVVPTRFKGSALLLVTGGVIVAVTTFAAWRVASRSR